MKNAVILAIIVIFITSCSPDVDVKPAEQPEQDANVGEILDTSEVPPVTLPEPPNLEMPEEVKALIDMSSKADAGYQFTYIDKNGYEAYRALIKDDSIKIQYRKDEIYARGIKYNYAFLNTKFKTAFGLCDTETFCPDTMNQKVEINYQQHLPEMLPLEFVRSIIDGEVIDSQNCDKNHPCTRIRFTDSSGRKGTASLDNYYGLPYDITYDGKTYRYTNVAIGVRSDQMSLP